MAPIIRTPMRERGIVLVFFAYASGYCFAWCVFEKQPDTAVVSLLLVERLASRDSVSGAAQTMESLNRSESRHRAIR
jgi:hypothetical protein